MKMVGHDHELIQRHLGPNCSGAYPLLPDYFTQLGVHHRAAPDLAEQVCSAS